MGASAEAELAAKIQLQRLSKLRKLQARAMRGTGFIKWAIVAGVPLVVMLVSSGTGLVVRGCALALAVLLLALVQLLGDRVDAIVQLLEHSGAFRLSPEDEGQAR